MSKEFDIRLVKSGSRYEARFDFDYSTKDFVKNNGFRFDPDKKTWWTQKIEIAQKLAPYATDAVIRDWEDIGKASKASTRASRATHSDFEVPCPDGLAYLPYQLAGIEFIANRTATLLADEMGLGKTIQIIGAYNWLTENDPKFDGSALIVCPASLKLNWERELRKWLTVERKIHIINGSAKPSADADIYIINYDILSKHKRFLDSKRWGLVAVDEAHYLKSPKANRTKQIFGFSTRTVKSKQYSPIRAYKKVLMTGTPITNRPVELWPLLNYLDDKYWGLKVSKSHYEKHFCNAHNNGFGWDNKGSANREELSQRLRESVMIRRLKSEVLTDLPDKQRQVIELQATKSDQRLIDKEYAKLKAVIEQARINDTDIDFEQSVKGLTGSSVAFTEMAHERKLIGLQKVDRVIEHVYQVAKEHPVVVFAWHVEVIDKIVDTLRLNSISTVRVTGDTPQDQRQVGVDAFQNGDARVFVGNIQSAGVGLTLTASSHVVFAENNWTPSSISQSEDRCHRIGQRDSVLVQHLVIEGSLDAQIAKTVCAKQELIRDTLDVDHGERRAVKPAVFKAPVKRPVTLPKVQRGNTPTDTPIISEESREACLTALGTLSANCDGAHAKDGMGFNGLDTDFGKSLARATRLSDKQYQHGAKLVRKYRRQLPDALVDLALGIN